MKNNLLCYLCTINLVLLQALDTSNFACDPQATYQENKCNYCSCVQSNGEVQFKCGLLPFIDPLSKLLFGCDPGTEFKLEGNQCWCLKHYGTICKISKLEEPKSTS